MNLQRKWLLASWLFGTLSLLSVATASSLCAEEGSCVPLPAVKRASFIPPTGWRAAPPPLPESILALVIGKGNSSYPPSMNLAVEPFSGTLQEYQVIMQQVDAKKGMRALPLGTTETAAGRAVLTQTEQQSAWGRIKMVHALLIAEGHAYIITCAAPADEFSHHYKAFFTAIRSFSLS